MDLHPHLQCPIRLESTKWRKRAALQLQFVSTRIRVATQSRVAKEVVLSRGNRGKQKVGKGKLGANRRSAG